MMTNDKNVSKNKKLKPNIQDKKETCTSEI